MKKLVTGLWLAACAATAGAEELAPREWTMRYVAVMLTPPATLASVVDNVDLDPKPLRAETLDIVAERLTQHVAQAGVASRIERNSVEYLARRPGGRYRLVMRRIIDSHAPVGAKIAAREALLAGGEADAYVPGTIDLEALRLAYIQKALATTPSEAHARKLGELARGDTLERLFAVMGYPDHARSIAVHGVRRFLYYYRGAGRVVFGYVGGEGWRLQSVTADPILFETEMPYRARAAEFGQPDEARLRMIMLSSNRQWPVKEAVEAAYGAPGVPLEFLDAAAAYLAQNWRTVDDESQDTLSWIVRLLTKRGGVRYKALLREVEDDTHSLKLRKWAGFDLRAVPGIPATRFDPATVSFPALAEKYPFPYPDVEFTLGRL